MRNLEMYPLAPAPVFVETNDTMAKVNVSVQVWPQFYNFNSSIITVSPPVCSPLAHLSADMYDRSIWFVCEIAPSESPLTVTFTADDGSEQLCRAF